MHCYSQDTAADIYKNREMERRNLQGVYDGVHPKISPTISFSGMYQNHLFIVGIGPILNKDLKFIYRSDRSDLTYVYSSVS